jgi:hypothetical protein
VRGTGKWSVTDLALASVGDEAIGWARRSAEGYESAYHRLSSPYLGTTAANLWSLAGDDKRGMELAESVLESGIEDDGSYWSAVAEAECALLLGRIDQADAALKRAGTAADSDHAARHHPPAVAACLSNEGDRRDHPRAGEEPGCCALHRASDFVGGRRQVPGRGGSESRRRTAKSVRLPRREDRIRLPGGRSRHPRRRGVARPGSGTPGRPSLRARRVRAGVGGAGRGGSGGTVRALSGRRLPVTTAIRGEYLDDPVLFDFCARIAMGDALVRAGVLETEAVQVAVWDGDHRGGDAGTEADVARWRATGSPHFVIPVGNGGVAPLTAADRSKPQVRGLVFADVAGSRPSAMPRCWSFRIS